MAKPSTTAYEPIVDDGPAGGRPAWAVIGPVALIGVIADALTAWGQSALPHQVTSLANSVGTWSLIAFLLALLAPTVRVALLTGAVALAALLVGYDVASHLRGYPSGSSLLLFWGAAAVIAGPLLGLAAYWARRAGHLAGVGVGAMSGVLVGEGVYGLRVIADTTYPPYWRTEIGAGIVLAAGVAVLRRWPARTTALAAVTLVAVAAAFTVAYHFSGGLIGAL